MSNILFFFLFLSFSSTAQLWQDKGGPIYGDTPGDYLGYDSRISGDGNTIIIGSAAANSGDGYTRVFGWDGNNWVQKGNDFIGETNSLEGRATDINFDGTIIITSAYAFDTPLIIRAGRVRAYQ